MSKVMRASADATYYCEDSYFLGSALRDKQKELIGTFYDGYEQGIYDELVLCAGMKGGKTILLNHMLLYEVFKLLVIHDPVKYYNFIPGTKIFCTSLSFSEEQAVDTVMAPILGMISNSEFFDDYRYKETATEIRFKDNDVYIKVGGVTSPGLLGKTNKFIGFDELSRYGDTTNPTSGTSNYQAMKKQLAAFKDKQDKGVSCAVSSPLHETDPIYRIITDAKLRFKKGPDDYGVYTLTDRLVAHYPTWVMNPGITKESLDDEFSMDYSNAMRDYAAIPTGGVEVLIKDMSIVKLSHNHNILEFIYHDVPFNAKAGAYVLAGDPALRGTSFGIAIGHKEREMYMIDGLWRFKANPVINPKEVANFIYKVVAKVPVMTALFDTWMYPGMQMELSELGVVVENHIVRKPDYDTFIQLCYQDKMDICNYPYILDELKSAEVKSGVKVTCPRTAFKDVADAMMNVIYGLDNYEPPAYNSTGVVFI